MNTQRIKCGAASKSVCIFVAVMLVVALLPWLAQAEELEGTQDGGVEGAGLQEVPAQFAVSEEGGEASDEQFSDLKNMDEGLIAEQGEYSAASMVTDEEVSEVLDALDGSDSRNLSSDARSTNNIDPVTYLYGADRYETAAKEARYAYPNGSKTVIVAGGSAWADALSGTGLAGVFDCPILLSDAASIPQATSDAIVQLGATHVILLGGVNSISASVENAFNSVAGVASVERLSGQDRFDTQLAVYEYGKGKWSNDLVVVAGGMSFPDALSASPLAFAEKVPIFLTGSDGDLTVVQKQTLVKAVKDGARFSSTVVLGSEAVTSERTEGFLWGLSQVGSGVSKGTVRLGGATRYDTSALIAQWCVDKQYLTWDKAAFVSGSLPYDALAGSVVQGKDESVMLLADAVGNSSVTKAVEHSTVINAIKFFGGDGAISAGVKAQIVVQLGLLPNMDKWSSGISLDAMVKAEVNSNANKQYTHYTYAEILEYLDPVNFPYGTVGFYQFAVLSNGYSNVVSADQINSYIASVPKGASGMLAGQGASFVKAARESGVNEVYLLAHAVLESGWGTSELAKGYRFEGGVIDGKMYPAGTYYNFYGIGAYDSSPLSGGRKLAIINGWDSPEKAIVGAAVWVEGEYLANAYGPQNSLYKMKWDFYHARLGQDPWKQYATSRTWAYGISKLMDECYRRSGIKMEDTGLAFAYPVFD
ncbi:MAG: cell wall-binding repeat-containing protein [Gordonibacter sp.]|uniref:cell wall-binding repeat-containing protein n=1 Tax=Gordonibacter sp. TaxID=1968902 RepID=UPI002FCC30FC